MIGMFLSIMLAVLPQMKPQCNDAKLKQMVRDSDVVLIAEVKEVQAPSLMQAWSGLVVFKQYVRYEVKAVLKGEMSQSEVRVGYPIYYKSLTADKSRPQLSPELFKEKNLHIVFLKLDKDSSKAEAKQQASSSYVALDINFGAIMDTSASEEQIRHITSTPRGN